MGETIFRRSVSNRKSGVLVEVTQNFQKGFPKSLRSISLQNEISGFSLQMVSTLCSGLVARTMKYVYSFLPTVI